MARRRKKGPQCPNCGTELRTEFEFCPHCGQENHDLRVPFKTFLYEFIENLTHFDTKLWNTLKVIFTRPGQLTRDYVEGKRARYVNPARFYLFISIIFFALVTVELDRTVEHQVAVTGEDDPRLLRRSRLRDIAGRDTAIDPEWKRLGLEDVDVHIPIDSPHYRHAATHLRLATSHTLDSLLAGADEDTLAGSRALLRRALVALPDSDSLNVPYSVFVNGMLTSFSRRREEAFFHKGHMTEADVDSLLGADKDSVGWFQRRAIRSLGRIDLTNPEGKKRIGHAIVKAVSVIMFILMPFTAVLLLWIFFRKRFYWEHLIFSVHIHTIYFLFAVFLMLIDLVTPGDKPDWTLWIPVLICAAYLLVSLRRVYGRSWRGTLVRALVMGIPYLLVFLILLATGALWGFFSL